MRSFFGCLGATRERKQAPRQKKAASKGHLIDLDQSPRPRQRECPRSRLLSEITQRFPSRGAPVLPIDPIHIVGFEIAVYGLLDGRKKDLFEPRKKPEALQ